MYLANLTRLFLEHTTPTGTANFLTTLDGGVIGNSRIIIDGVAGELISDTEGKATIKLPAGTYSYSADSNGNVFSGSFTIVRDAVIGVEVAFRDLAFKIMLFVLPSFYIPSLIL